METEKKSLPGVFALIKQSLSLYGKNYKTFISLGLISVVLSLISNLLFSSMKVDPNDFSYTSINILILGFVISLVVWVIQMCSMIAILGAIPALDKGEKVSFKDAFRKSFGLFLSFLWVYILMYLTVVGCTILLIIPGIAVGGYLIFSLYARIVDEKKGLQALSTSFYYVKNNWWRVVLRFLGFGVIVAIVLIIVGALLYLLTLVIGSATSIRSLIIMSAGGGFAGSIWSLVFGFITTCIYVPIVFTFGYLLYKALKTTKSEPNPEVDFKKSNAWFKGLSIWGIVSPIILIFVVIIISIAFGFRSIMKNSVNGSLAQKFPQVQMQSSFPSDVVTLPIRLTSLEATPLTNKELGFSINLPKNWKSEVDTQGLSAALDLQKSTETALNIQRKVVPAEVNTVSDEVFMNEVAKNIFDDAGTNLTNINLGKYNISSKIAYTITGILAMPTGPIEVNYYFIKDGLNVYIITTTAKNNDLNGSAMLSDSINTFKIIK